jgi:uncharacterized damage-inducible protein DinB
MTTIDEIRDLLAYDAWATGQFIEAVTTLGGAAPGSAASWTRDWNGPRTSLRQQLVHLVITVDTYRALLQGKEPPQERPEEFAQPAALAAFHDAVQERVNALLNELPHDVLNTVAPWRKKQDTLLVSPAEILRHVVNHGTYHRGQVATLLKLHGVDFPETDYISWKNKRNAVPVTSV